MFGSKSREIKSLVAANTDLTNEITSIKENPWYGVAQQLHQGVVEIVESGGADKEIDELVTAQRGVFMAAQIQARADHRTAELIRTEKSAIDEEIREGAEPLAREALERFLQNDAGHYRDEISEHIVANESGKLIARARREIRAEIEAAKVAALKEEMHGGGYTYTREEYKVRARDIRQATKDTPLLPLSMFEDGDPLTIAFTYKGKGHQPLTDGFSYRSDMEARRIKGKLIEHESGLFSVEKDSWLGKSDAPSPALYPGQEVTLHSLDPVSQEQRPLMVKGEPLGMRMDNRAMGSNNVELWWVNLNDFRAFS